MPEKITCFFGAADDKHCLKVLRPSSSDAAARRGRNCIGGKRNGAAQMTLRAARVCVACCAWLGGLVRPHRHCQAPHSLDCRRSAFQPTTGTPHFCTPVCSPSAFHSVRHRRTDLILTLPETNTLISTTFRAFACIMSWSGTAAHRIPPGVRGD